MSTIQESLNEYKRWLDNTEEGTSLHNQLIALAENQEELVESFYKSLVFGTSGIRGIIGAGTNRINSLVVRRTTIGLAEYLKSRYLTPSVVIAYDSRKYSKEFAQLTARVLSGKGIKTYIFSELTPVSVLSYAIGRLECTMGVMITASHNPKIFNGYKVYNSKGYQVVGSVPDEILEEINRVDYFDIPPESEDNITVLGGTIGEEFIEKVCEMMPVILENDVMADIRLVYTPLNGTGGKYVKEIFRRLGFSDVVRVPAQDYPDEDFTTCPVPNPEKLTAYKEGLRIMDQYGGDIVIATDPDSDRVGAAIMHKGMKTSISGNQLGILMLDFLCQFRDIEEGRFIMKSIVTTPLAESIARDYGIKTVNTLTGFKYIGEKIADLMEEGQENRFFMGLEESNGFLMDPFIRDKDGVSSAVIIALMAAYHKSQGKDLLDRLDEIYSQYGLCFDRTKNYVYEGRQGVDTMNHIMEYFRKDVGEKLGGQRILSRMDYLIDNTGLPKSNVIELHFEDGTTVIIRPSGTEPKMKVYMFLTDVNSKVEEAVEKVMKSFY